MADLLGQLHHQLFSPWRVLRSSPRWLLHLNRWLYSESAYRKLHIERWIIGQCLRHACHSSRHCDSEAPNTIHSRRNRQRHSGDGIGSIHHICYHYSWDYNSSFCHLDYDTRIDNRRWQYCSNCYCPDCDYRARNYSRTKNIHCYNKSCGFRDDEELRTRRHAKPRRFRWDIPPGISVEMCAVLGVAETCWFLDSSRYPFLFRYSRRIRCFSEWSKVFDDIQPMYSYRWTIFNPLTRLALLGLQ